MLGRNTSREVINNKLVTRNNLNSLFFRFIRTALLDKLLENGVYMSQVVEMWLISIHVCSRLIQSQ